MRIVVSGGGTAGHISPILALVSALKQQDSTVELLYIGQATGLEAKIAAGAGIEFASISAGKFRRFQGEATALYKLANAIGVIGPNLRDMARLAKGISSSLRILRQFRPDVVFIKGGYVGLPVGLAARMLRLPCVIHESDTTLGLTNRILSRSAMTVAVGFPTSYYHGIDTSHLVYTGNPVRAEITKSHRLQGLAAFKLDSGLPVVMVTGGSQGASLLNDVLIEALPQLLQHCQVIHVTGELEIERVGFELKRMGQFPNLERYQAHAFLAADMGAALAAADIVISRAGANTIAELAALAKPTILVPNTTMAAHQVATARLLARHGAARVLDESRLSPQHLVAEVAALLDSETEQAYLSSAIAALAMPNAAHDLAELVITAGKKPEKLAEQHAHDETDHGALDG